MPEVYKESRTYTRERGDSSSDDEKYQKKTTVRRYKVGGGNHVERIERDDMDDDLRSHYSSRHGGRSSQGNLLEVDRRTERSYIPERPRSAFDSNPRASATVVERSIERERDRDYYDRDRDYRDFDRGGPDRTRVTERERVVERDRDDRYDVEPRSRTAVVERKQVVERETDRYDDDSRERRVYYEKTKEVERDRDPGSGRDWDRRSYAPWDERDRETDVRVEKRVERRDDGEVRVERRVVERRNDSDGDEVERYRKETEYYEPAPAPQPIVIRQRAPEQKIIVQEAPPPPPVVIPRQDPGFVVIHENRESREVARRPDPRDEEYYYHRESREVGPYRGREEDYAMERYERRDVRRGRDRRDYDSDGNYSDDDYIIRRTVVRKERSRSPSHHKLELAGGAVAGAGLAAILSSRRNGEHEIQEHRGRKVVAGAALGALGTEVFKRAKSAYEDRFGDERGRSRSRTPERHSKLKTGLGIAAAALAVAGAAKYYQTQKEENEEMSRGRSRRRYSSDEYSRSRSRKRSKSRAASVAKVAAGTAAVAGLVKHFRSKSRGGGSRSRSKSRLRTGAEIVAAGLAGAAGKKIYDNIKDKREAKRDRDAAAREFSDDEYYDGRRSSRSRSRSRSAARPPYSPSAADPELGLVEYGTHPLHSEPPYPPPPAGYGYGARGYDSAEDERRHGHHHHRRRSGSRGYDSESDDGGKKKKKERSRSRLREMAAAGAGAAAAAIGLKKYEKNKEKKRRESESRSRDRGDRDRDRNFDRDSERDRDRRRDRERERERYEDEIARDDYYDPRDPGRAPSPPHASGGAYYPPSGPPPPPVGMGGFTQHPNMGTTNLNDMGHPYNPADYSGYPPPPPGPPPPNLPNTGGIPPPPTGQHRNPDPPHGENVSKHPRHPHFTSTPEASGRDRETDGVTRSASPTRPPDDDGDAASPRRTVAFNALSPQSSRTLRALHATHDRHPPRDPDISPKGEDGPPNQSVVATRPDPRRRRSSDPSSDRPLVRLPRRPASPTSDDDSEEVIEVLPDRFDAQGRPLDSSTHPNRRWTSRAGDFAYRSPRPGGWNMRGSWGVAGTDPAAVDRLARGFTGALDGRAGLLGTLGGLLGSGLLGQRRPLPGRERDADSDDDRAWRRPRRRD